MWCVLRKWNEKLPLHDILFSTSLNISTFPNTLMRRKGLVFFQRVWKSVFRHEETSYIRTQVKSCMKPGEGVNPGTHFLKPGDIFTQPGANPEQARAKPRPKMGWNPVDETRDPVRILANPGSTRPVKHEPRVNPEQKFFTLRVSETGCSYTVQVKKNC